MANKRILLVDDDRVTLDALRTLLKSRGFDVGTCQDGAQALDLTRSGGWDLVVLDLGLPSPDPGRVARFDGLKVLKWLKLLHQKVPVLVFTSSQDPEMTEATLAAGAVGLVRKGDPIETFLHAVSQALAQSPAPRPASDPNPAPPPTDPPPRPLIWSDHGDHLQGS